MSAKGNAFMKEEPGFERPSSSLGMQSAIGKPLASSLAAQNMYASLQQQKLYAAQQAAHFGSTNSNYVLEMTENTSNNVLDGIFKTASTSAPGGTLNQMLLREENGLKKMGRKIENHQQIITKINRTNNNIITNDDSSSNSDITANNTNARTAMPISGDLKLKLKKKPMTTTTSNITSTLVGGSQQHNEHFVPRNSNGFQQIDQFSSGQQLCRSGSSSSSSGQHHHSQQKTNKLKQTTTTTAAVTMIPKAVSAGNGNVISHSKSHSSTRNSNSSFCNNRSSLQYSHDRSLSPAAGQIQSRDGQSSKSKERAAVVAGVGKPAKKSVTPNKKNKNNKSNNNKEGVSPGKKQDNQIKDVARTQNSQKQQQMCLFQNKLIQDASICLVPAGSAEKEQQYHHNASQEQEDLSQYEKYNDAAGEQEQYHSHHQNRLASSNSPNATFSFRDGPNTPTITKNQKKSITKNKNKKTQQNTDNQQQQSLNRSITPERDAASRRLFSNTDNITQPGRRISANVSSVVATAAGKASISPGNELKNHGMMHDVQITQKRSKSRSSNKNRQRASSSQGGRSSSASKVHMNDSYNQQQHMQNHNNNNHRDTRKTKGADQVTGARSKSQQGGKRDNDDGQQLLVTANVKAKLKEDGLKKKQQLQQTAVLGRQQQQQQILLQTSQSQQSQMQQFAWGVDQQKANRSRKDQSNSNNHHHHTKTNRSNSRDKSTGKDSSFVREASKSPENRDSLGLQYINGLTEDHIKQLLATQKIRVQKAAAASALEKENQSETNAEIQRQLQLYMQLQKRLKQLQMQQTQQAKEERDRNREIKKKNPSSNLLNGSRGNASSAQAAPAAVPRSRSSQRQVSSSSSEQIASNMHNRSLNISEHVSSSYVNQNIDDSRIDYENIHAQYRELMHESAENNRMMGGFMHNQQQQQLLGQRQLSKDDQQQQQKQQQQQQQSKPIGLAARTTVGTTFYKTAQTPPLIQTQNELVEQQYATVIKENNTTKNGRFETKKSSSKPQTQVNQLNLHHSHGDSIDELEEKKRQLRMQYSQIADRFKKQKTIVSPHISKPSQDHQNHNDSSNQQYVQQGTMMSSMMNQALEEFTDGGNITIPFQSSTQFQLAQGKQADQMHGSSNSNSQSRSSHYHSTNTPPTHSSLAHSRPHSKLSDTHYAKQQQQQQQQNQQVSNSTGLSATPAHLLLKKKTKKVSPKKKSKKLPLQQQSQQDKNISTDTLEAAAQHSNLMEYLRRHLTPVQLSAITPEQFQHLRLLWQQEQQLQDQQQADQEELEHHRAEKIEEEEEHEEEEEEEEVDQDQEQEYDDQAQSDGGHHYQITKEGQEVFQPNQQYYQDQWQQQQQQQQPYQEEEDDQYHSNSSYIGNGDNHDDDGNGIVVISDEPFEIEELDTSNFSERPYCASKSLLNTCNFNDTSTTPINHQGNHTQGTKNGRDTTLAQSKEHAQIGKSNQIKTETADGEREEEGEEQEEAESMSEMRRIEKEYQQQQLERSTQLLQSRSGKSQQQHRHQNSYGLNKSSSSHNIADQSNMHEGIERPSSSNQKELEENDDGGEQFEKKKQAARVILRAFRSLKTATLLQMNYQKYFAYQQYEHDEEEELYDQLNKGMQVGMSSERGNYDADNTDRLRGDGLVSGGDNRIAQSSSSNHEMHHRLDHHFNLLLNLPQSEIKQYQQHLNSLGTDVKQYQQQQFQDSGDKSRIGDGSSELKQEKLAMLLTSSNKKKLIKQQQLQQQSQFSDYKYDVKSFDEGEDASIQSGFPGNYVKKQALNNDDSVDKQRRYGEQKKQVQQSEEKECSSNDLSGILQRNSEQKVEQSQAQQSQYVEEQFEQNINDEDVDDDDIQTTNKGNGSSSLKLLEKQFECVLKELNHSERDQNNNDEHGTFRVDFNDDEDDNEEECSLHLHNDKYNTEVKKQPGDMNATDTWRDSARSSAVESQQKQQQQQQLQLLQPQEKCTQLDNSSNTNNDRAIQKNKIIQQEECNGTNENLQEKKKDNNNTNHELMEILNRQQVLQQDQAKAATRDSKNISSSVKPQQGLKARKNLNLVIKADEEEADERDQNNGGHQQQQQPLLSHQQHAQSQQKKQINQVQKQSTTNEDDSSNLISELGIIEEWKSESNNNNSKSNQQRLTSNSNNSKEQQQNDEQFINTQDINGSAADDDDNKPRNRLYETDVQALAGTMMLVEDSRQSTMQFQRLDWPLPATTFDASKLSSMIIGGQMKYQASEDEEQQEKEKQVEVEQNQIDSLVESKEKNQQEHDDSLQEQQQSTVMQKKNKMQQQQQQQDNHNNQDFSDEDSLSQSNLKKRSRQRRPSRSQDWSDSELSSSQQSHHSIISSSSNVRSSKQSLSSTQKGILKQQYESEISKIKQEEAFKWNQMISILTSLQNQGSLPKEAADQLNRLTQLVQSQEKEEEGYDTRYQIKQLPSSNNNSVNSSNKKKNSKSERSRESPFQFDLQISSEKKYNNYINISSNANNISNNQQSYSARLSCGSSQRKKDLQIEVADQLSDDQAYRKNHNIPLDLEHRSQRDGEDDQGSNNNGSTSQIMNRNSKEDTKSKEKKEGTTTISTGFQNMTTTTMKKGQQEPNSSSVQDNSLERSRKNTLEDIDHQQLQQSSSPYSSSVESSSMLSESYHSALSKSIFEVDSFADQHHQHYDTKRITHLLLHPENLDKICSDRERALKTREEAQKQQLETMLRGQKISPKSFQHKQQELEKWVTKEQLSIKKTQKRMQKTILSTEETIKKTQRDIEFARQRENKGQTSSAVVTEDMASHNKSSSRNEQHHAQNEDKQKDKENAVVDASSSSSEATSQRCKKEQTDGGIVIPKSQCENMPEEETNIPEKVQELLEINEKHSEMHSNSNNSKAGLIVNHHRHNHRQPHLKVSPATSSETLQDQEEQEDTILDGEEEEEQHDDGRKKQNKDLIVMRKTREIADQQQKNNTKKDSQNHLNQESMNIRDEQSSLQNTLHRSNEDYQKIQKTDNQEEGDDEEEEKLSESVEHDYSNNNNHSPLQDQHHNNPMKYLEESPEQQSQDHPHHHYPQNQQRPSQSSCSQPFQPQNSYLKLSGDKSELNYSSDNLTESLLTENNSNILHKTGQLDGTDSNINASKDTKMCSSISIHNYNNKESQQVLEGLIANQQDGGQFIRISQIVSSGKQIVSSNEDTAKKQAEHDDTSDSNKDHQRQIGEDKNSSNDVYDLVQQTLDDIIQAIEFDKKTTTITKIVSGDHDNLPLQKQQAQKAGDNIVKAAQPPAVRKPAGFKTGIQSVKEYLALVTNHIKGDADYKIKFISHINTWLGPQPEELLKLLHMYEESQLDMSDEEDDDSSYLTQPILDGKLYADIERTRQAGLQPPVDTRESQMRTLERIHNKSIFEAFNEALDSERMYGLHGKPFPWKVTAMRLSVRPRDDEAIPSILQHASDQVVMWSQSLCGLLVDKPESYFLPGVKLDEEQLRQIKEDRLTRLLAQEVIENEEKWLQYDEEETEVQVELAQMVFEALIEEASEEYIKIAFKHSMLFPSKL